MSLVSLPKSLEDALRELERLGAEASSKIDEATQIVDHSADDVLDDCWDDPSVVRHVADLKRTSARAKAESQPPLNVSTRAPLAIGTPPTGSAGPTLGPGSRPRGSYRPPKRPPTKS